MSLKRKRSTSPEWLLLQRVNPALPELSADRLLTVFTHPSLGLSAEIADNTRFQTLGSIALEYAVARLVLAPRPGRPAPDHVLAEKMRTLLSNENVAAWSREYRLRDRLRFGPDSAASVEKDAEQASLFKAYVGAVDLEHGPTVLSRWIEELINAPPLDREPPPLDRKPPPPTAPAPEPSGKAGAFSAKLNEMVQLHKLRLDFKAESVGPPHSLTWTMHLYIDGHEEASGCGSSKTAAKEEAARLVCHDRRWNL